jgi:hypothetical protein
MRGGAQSEFDGALISHPNMTPPLPELGGDINGAAIPRRDEMIVAMRAMRKIDQPTAAIQRTRGNPADQGRRIAPDTGQTSRKQNPPGGVV